MSLEIPVELKYGRSKVLLHVPADNLLDILWPNTILSDDANSEKEMIEQAMEHPIGTPRLCEIAKNKKKVCIIVSDITRPVPSHLILPFILDELKIAGIEERYIKIVFGLGSHREHTNKEKEYLVGKEAFSTIQCLDHNPHDCVSMGNTRQGLPIEIFREVAEADFRICTGNIDLHYFAGYTGGAKAIMPGVSSRRSIATTHRFMLDPLAVAGNLNSNPARTAIDEVGEIVGIDFIVNVVLDEHKKVLKAVAGDKIAAHRAGCLFLDQMFKVGIKEKADIVIVSAGGYPKDINLYQAQKALDNAKYAVKDGGTIILVAECPEGLGEEVFKDWMYSAQRPEDILERVKNEFSLGGHKAVAIAMLLQTNRITLVSNLEKEIVDRLFFRYGTNVQESLNSALNEYGPNSSVRVIPFGSIILPFLC